MESNREGLDPEAGLRELSGPGWPVGFLDLVWAPRPGSVGRPLVDHGEVGRLPAQAVWFWHVTVFACVTTSGRLTFVANVSSQRPVVARCSVPRALAYVPENKFQLLTLTVFYFRKTIHKMSFKKKFPLRHNTKKKGMSCRCWRNRNVYIL